MAPRRVRISLRLLLVAGDVGENTGTFHIDHRTAVSREPDLKTDYDNFIYTRASCNLVKLAVEIPDPLAALIAGAMFVEPDGRIATLVLEAERIVELLDLNSDEEIETRARLTEMIALLAELRPEQYRKWMGFPRTCPTCPG